ncbi:MAG: hypothetical protein QM796_11385 [Chthoniobacteraceae bacterium]
MRYKEMSHDYRYFPDPDLLPVKSDAFLEEVRQRLPELPSQKRARFVEHIGVSPYDAGVLANDLDLAGYFETAAKGAKKPKNVANWILNDLQSALSNAGRDNHRVPDLARIRSTNSSTSSTRARSIGKQAKEVFAEMFATPGKAAGVIVEGKGA